jgi:hypothetical protein
MSYWKNLRKLRRTEGGASIFGVFRVKNHDFNQFWGGGGRIFYRERQRGVK